MITSSTGPSVLVPNTVWSLPERQALFGIYEIAAGCFELGKTSIKLSHEAIAFLSSSDEVDSAAAHSRGQLLAAAISAITIASTELQKAVETAQVAMSALHKFDFRAKMDINIAFDFRLSWYFTEKQHLPLGHWAEKLGEILSSISAQEIATTKAMLNNVITVFQGHIVRVYFHGLSIAEIFGPSLTVNIDSPLMDNFRREVLPGATDYVGVLVNYVGNDRFGGHWNPDILMKILDENVISILMYLEIHLSDFPNEMTLPLSELLAQYAVVFTSLLSAFSSTLAVEQYLHRLINSDTHLLALDPSVAFQPLVTQREASQRALTEAHSSVNFLISRLKQCQEDSVVAGWPKPSENTPELLECFKCVVTILLEHSEAFLQWKTHQWKWVTSEPKSDVTLVDAIRPLFSKSSMTQRFFHLKIFECLFPYHQIEVVDTMEVDPQLSRTSQPPFALHLAFGPHHDQHSFWAQLSSLVNKQREHNYPGTSRVYPQSLTLFERWRPCTCKKQIEFAAQSRQSKNKEIRRKCPKFLIPYCIHKNLHLARRNDIEALSKEIGHFSVSIGESEVGNES